MLWLEPAKSEVGGVESFRGDEESNAWPKKDEPGVEKTSSSGIVDLVERRARICEACITVAFSQRCQ